MTVIIGLPVAYMAACMVLLAAGGEGPNRVAQAFAAYGFLTLVAVETGIVGGLSGFVGGIIHFASGVVV